MSEKTRHKTGETENVTFRLPVRVASNMGCAPGQRGAQGGDWTWFRAVLERWAQGGSPLEGEMPEPTRVYTMRMPRYVVRALETEAQRLTKKTGRKWTVARVARKIWDRACDSGVADELAPE